MATPKSTETFLRTFNQIEKQLNRVSGMDPRAPFTKKLYRAIQNDPTIGVHSEALELYNDLRNLIVHSGPDVAMPLKATLAVIEHVRRSIDTPPLLAPTFRHEIVWCNTTDPILSVVRQMEKKDFSQLPVYHGRLLKGVITTAAIARWLGAHGLKAVVNLKTPVADVMVHEEYPDAWEVFRATDTVGRALASFNHAAEAGRPLYAILLTEDGKRDSPPRGVLTLFDVPVLWKLALRNA